MYKIKLSFILIALIAFAGCKKTDNGNLKLNITGLEDLGANARYEGWLMIDGSPKTTGIFTVNSSGAMSTNSFIVNQEDLDKATKFILTVEPFPDPSTSPSDQHLLAGTFSGTNAALTINAPEALGNNFSTATGKYVLATPSDGENTNEKSGLWFLGTLPPSVGLVLPTLPTGWIYEGWAVIGGKAITTGRFNNVSGVDLFSGFSGSMGTPLFPGEDFILNAPTGFTFPADLSGGKAVISIEPQPDNSPSPFLLKPLLADIPAAAADHVVYNMNNIISSNAPTGSASK